MFGKNKKIISVIILTIVIISLFAIIGPTTYYVSKRIGNNSKDIDNMNVSSTTSNYESSLPLTSAENGLDDLSGLYDDEGSLIISFKQLESMGYIEFDSGLLTTKEFKFIDEEDNEIKNTTIECNVILGDCITALNNNSFYNWSGLKSITFSSSIESIGVSSFTYCTSLCNVYYNGEISSWYKLASPVFKYSNNSNHLYQSNLEQQYEEVTSINIPSDMDEIIANQFDGYNNIKSIYIPNSIKSIGFEAFHRVSVLETLQIPFVGQDASSYNNRHLGYIFGARLEDENSLYVPSTLVNLTISNQEKISNRALYNLSFLEHVIVGDKTIYIGEEVFYGCTSLDYLVLPASLLSIGNDAFYGCNINDIYFKGTEYKWEKQIVYSNDYSHPEHSLDESGKLLLRSDDVYLYSKDQPQKPQIATKYWYYNDEGIPTVWNELKND